jgi:hypothetical protein
MTIQELIDYLQKQPDKSIPVVFMAYVNYMGEEVEAHIDFDLAEIGEQVSCSAEICSHKGKKHLAL